MSFFTDPECENEYIVHLPIPKDDPNYTGPAFMGPYNVDNRTTQNTVYNVPYTDVKTYLNPAPSTNAKYYKIYKEYPSYP
jgi:hypothetical protein